MDIENDFKKWYSSYREPFPDDKNAWLQADVKNLYRAFKAGKKSAMCEAGSNAVLGEGWRDARNELPDVEREVLVYFAGAYCVMMRLKYTSPKGETEIKWSDGNRSYIGVDAWMPLPDPPAFA